MILANERGRRGERYLAAVRRIPLWLMHLLAAGYEAYARLTGRPVLLSWAMARTIATEDDRSHYDPAKGERELGPAFPSGGQNPARRDGVVSCKRVPPELKTRRLGQSFG